MLDSHYCTLKKSPFDTVNKLRTNYHRETADLTWKREKGKWPALETLKHDLV